MENNKELVIMHRHADDDQPGLGLYYNKDTELYEIIDKSNPENIWPVVGIYRADYAFYATEAVNDYDKAKADSTFFMAEETLTNCRGDVGRLYAIITDNNKEYYPMEMITTTDTPFVKNLDLFEKLDLKGKKHVSSTKEQEPNVNAQSWKIPLGNLGWKAKIKKTREEVGGTFEDETLGTFKLFYQPEEDFYEIRNLDDIPYAHNVVAIYQNEEGNKTLFLGRGIDIDDYEDKGKTILAYVFIEIDDEGNGYVSSLNENNKEANLKGYKELEFKGKKH